MKMIFLLSTMLAISLALPACGGGGGGGAVSSSANPIGATSPDNSQATAPPPPGDSGSVSASFAKGNAARYVLSGIGQIVGNLTNHIQAADGAVTALDNNTLSGQTVVKDINGDASFALGRWSQGTVTTTNGSTLLDDTSNNAYHYVLFNNLASLPTSGTYNCDTGKFTAPTYIGGTNVTVSAYSGAATGSATLSFSAAGAALSATINTSAGGQTGAVTGTAVLSVPTATAFIGNYLGSGPGLVLTVSDGGAGRVHVIAPYRSTQSNGAKYQGIAVFSCSL
jgi:hypothetical protein